jgi:hypothetical protein
MSGCSRERFGGLNGSLEFESGVDHAPVGRADVTTLPAAIRSRVRALASDLAGVLQRETSIARETLRATFGAIRLVPDAGAVYAEFDDAAENLLLVDRPGLGR